jgi:hypothetical protein
VEGDARAQREPRVGDEVDKQVAPRVAGEHPARGDRGHPNQGPRRRSQKRDRGDDRQEAARRLEAARRRLDDHQVARDRQRQEDEQGNEVPVGVRAAPHGNRRRCGERYHLERDDAPCRPSRHPRYDPVD